MRLIDKRGIEMNKINKAQSILEYLIFMVWVVVAILAGTGLIKIGVEKSLDATSGQMQEDFFQNNQDGIVVLEAQTVAETEIASE